MTDIDKYKIYVYREEGILPDNDGNFWLKVGDTTRDVKTRIKEQTTASNRKALVQLYETATNFRDYKVHKKLEELGIEREPKKEWFYTNLNQIKKVINEFKYGVLRENSYSMRDEQQEAVNLAYDYFQKNSQSTFLWNAKMRFGKTFAAYQLARKMNALKVLVVTYKPVVVNEWENELNKHIDFEEYNFVRTLNSKEEIKLKDGDVLFSSFQDLLQDYTYDEEDITKKYTFKINKNKFNNLLNHFFDLIIIDEVHFGATNDLATKFLENLKYGNVLYLSGTPFKLLNNGALTDEQIYTWTYIDEQNKKNELIKKEVINENNPYWPLPKMSIIGYTPGESVSKDLKYFDTDEYFNFAKFFASKDGESFSNHQAVEHFIDILADKKSNVSPFFSKEIKGEAMKHTFWLLPGVNSTKALYYTLSKHNFFKDYNIVCASDNNLGEGKDTLQLVKRAINKKECKGSITLSCGKLTTGVTIKEWGSILLLTNMQAIETYFQSIFRVQSAGVTSNKQDCYVFDFDSSRMLKLMYTYAKKQSNKKNITDTVKKLLNTMNLLCYTDNNFVKLDTNNLLDMAKYGIGASMLQKKFESRKLLNLDLLNNLQDNQNIVSILDSIKIFRKINNTIEIEATTNKKGLIKGKTYKITEKEFNEDKKKRDKFQEAIRQKLQRLITRLPVFMYLSEYVEEKIEDVIINLEPTLFEEATGITVADFKTLKEANIFNIDNLNETVLAFKACELEVL